MKRKTAAVILAAGKGKRMRSSLPKVLHTCAELPLIVHVVRIALSRRCDPIVVVVDSKGRRIREVLTATFPDAPLVFVTQEKRLGTADAARVGLAAIERFKGRVLVLYGDVPLLRPATIGKLANALADGSSLALLTAVVDDPTGYGRVLREGRLVKAVVEHKDASAAQRTIREVNVGVYLCNHDLLRRAAGSVGRHNKQREAYLTDVVAMASDQNGAIGVKVSDPDEVRGVNTRAELAEAEAIMQRRLVSYHQSRGITIRDPRGTFIGAGVKIKRDVILGVGVQLWGNVTIGSGTRIEGPTVIRDSTVGSDAMIHAFSHLEGVVVGKGVSVGPFARLRPGARLDPGSRVGNFVEMKKARLGRGAKASHLTYLGDAEVGPGANIGAGTITCNYDGGPIKHRTHIGSGAFIGSNATLVAPVRVGANSYVAAGSTVNKNVPADALALGRSRQENKPGYAKRLRNRRKGKS